MTKLITVLIIAAVLFGIWELWVYYDKVDHEKESDQKQAAAQVIRGEQLSGMPYKLEQSLQTAMSHGATGLKGWLAAYGPRIQDPRKAWIELDYCVLIARDNPAEARRIFADVKARTPPTSPIWKRIQELSKSYE
jgi:hypothetical protein